ncbi:MAG: L-aspartate oxidase, partial [Candidatus Peribacteraceae bacterium]|nr:L-aspartate oxidase [Candidatus Peribacteraceae bacterium]
FLAEKGEVVLATKKNLLESSSRFAQAGVAAVRNFKWDSFEEHFADTLTAGCGINDKKAVLFLVENSPKLVDWLEKEVGVKFRKEPTREAAHSHSRVWNTNDSTGETIEKALAKKVRATPRVRILEKTTLLDLILKNKVCRGAWLSVGGKVKALFASKVILATGGFGQLFAKSTNPEVSAGDGIAAAYRAGAKLKDLEFIQFHPTALVGKQTRLTLLSESLRGEGAVLRNSRGERFLPSYHKAAELAPRDVVARAIFAELKNGPVFLDFTRADAKFLSQRFPLIWSEVKKAGFNLAKDLIPIFPVAHYSCGGVRVNLRGETSVKNLLAVGEVARTGLHGANRLASNSLAEALVFGKFLGTSLKPSSAKEFEVVPPKYTFSPSEDRTVRKIVRDLMWKRVGIVRTQKGLQEAVGALSKLNPKSFAAKNISLVAKLVAKAALARKKSLGTHYVEN